MSLGRALFLIAIAAAVVLPLRLFVFEAIYIASPSMEPTLAVNDHVFLDKFTLKLRDVRRGEIVVFRSPVGEDHGSVKRVIGVPGDTVEIRRKKVFVNGEPLDEPYVQHTRADERLAGDDLGPVVVPPRHYFVLGDNRDQSNDSSVWKDPETGERILFIPASSLQGTLRGIY